MDHELESGDDIMDTELKELLLDLRDYVKSTGEYLASGGYSIGEEKALHARIIAYLAKYAAA